MTAGVGRVSPLLALLGILTLAAPSSAQAVTERSPNLEGIWTPEPGVLRFHFVHRFQVTDPPTRKVLNSPTFLFAVGLPGDLTVGTRYATNSVLVAGKVNELEPFARWVLFREEDVGVDVGVQAAWNRPAESADGELLLGRELGRLRILAGGRAFSSFAAGDGEVAWVAGARVRLSRNVALAGDVSRVVGLDDADAAWGAGLQIDIPTTPHSLSLHVTNANTTTLQGASIGAGDRRWGFEFTVPITLGRYFGGRGDGAGDAEGSGPAGGRAGRAGDPAGGRRGAADLVVEMDDRLRFLPDTVRVTPGGTVEWRNTSRLVHTVTADPELAADPESVVLPEGAATFDSGFMDPGATFRHTFDVEGTYRYVCLPHQPVMFGVVIVGSADGR
ncbi:MAG: plastocyanin/azurin family copper-binding protein [Gemmatimonadota bacterium]